jgi:LIM domain kinase 1
VLVVDPEEVYRVASPNCPPKFIQLALDCCAVEQEKRPKMPEVLDRLRAIEVDVCARLTEHDGGEHVGSISIVKPGRARAMPDFSKPTDDELTSGEVEARVEEEAMVALRRMKIDIDGSGPSEGDEGLQGGEEGEGDSGMETWRTARWRERSDITMSSESSCESRL